MHTESPDGIGARLARRQAVGLLSGLVAACLGCRPRPPKIEFENRRYSAALRTAANTRSLERLERTKQLIARDQAAGRIAPAEQAWYEEIVALAEAGRWAEAEQRAIDFRRDQRH